MSKCKVLVQLRQGEQASSASCRFCGASLLGDTPQHVADSPALQAVCGSKECQERAALSCGRIHRCGHPCHGVAGENVCLPCLHGCVEEPKGKDQDLSTEALATSSLKKDKDKEAEKEKAKKLTQDVDDMCMICWTDSLGDAPSIQLDCGHVFHYKCTLDLLQKRWNGARITFGFAHCPICKQKIEHELLETETKPIWGLYKEVSEKALLRIEYLNLHQDDEVVKPGGKFYNDLAGYAMDRLCYYMCHKCKKPYFGGERQCAASAPDNFNPEELVCAGCSSGSTEQNCPKHGKDFLDFKCRFCCSVAVWFCFGTTHFCDSCHNNHSHLTSMDKEDMPQCPVGPGPVRLAGDECPLMVKHPPTGEEFALGCGICRNTRSF